ncbi:hypothetical protein [Mycetocola zhadangensis]|uniref:hypothetical protein n=1 Tax=Mycetocola zhadangensis TaxID=1164595 RepID=UPI0016001CB8|nr:hypothetical protein [Mycetocola zhadangensis]GGE99394.1 hypothetical protein GCM10011313_22950 [Mycetocola zhadangensis]
MERILYAGISFPAGDAIARALDDVESRASQFPDATQSDLLDAVDWYFGVHDLRESG